VGLTLLASVDPNGYGNFARVSAGQNSDLAYSAALSVNTTGTTTKGVVVRAVASQSANLQEWQDSSGGTVASISSLGSFANTATGILTKFIRLGGAGYVGTLSLIAESASTIGAVVRGAASQSANLMEWQTSTPTTVAKISAAGVFNAVTVSTTNGYSSLQEASSGGNLFMSRMTAAATNPGANNARIYLRDGTTAGTLKLVVRAGAAGAETTILDNIPQ
jgi:hypothetical protein